MFDTIKEFQVWLIYLLPLASFGLIAAHYLLPRSARPSPRLIGVISILFMLASFLLALWTLKVVMGAEEPGSAIGWEPHTWIEIGTLTINIGIRVDGLSATMLVVVTLVALLVQVYSQGYMDGDPGYPRYYAWLSLFTAAMLGLILASNILMLFIHWELVGLCSYMLIGFWFANPARPGYTSPREAAKKAFVVTRFGDFGFLLAILLIWSRTGTFEIERLTAIALDGGVLSSGVITLFALGIFAGAAGKSAQFPFHIWLPDAMEGPTPVSALIHAATMVAAGVYLVARLFPIYSVSSDAMNTVAIIGGITAFMAATMGMVMHDIKRVLAYSTISQLGYMMLALGTGGLIAGVFHLVNNAFFKAMLFLGSGSVNHSTGTFDMRKMGGLGRMMPITFITFVIGSLSLAGVPPLSGFWSKDEILVDAWHYNFFAFLGVLVVAFMTAFYMFRAIFLTFFGEFRGGDPSGLHHATAGAGHGDSGHAAQPAIGGDESHGGQALTTTAAHGDDHGGGHAVAVAHAPAAHDSHDAHDVMPHESPLVMWLPLVILVIPSIFSGFLNTPMGQHFEEFIANSTPEGFEVGSNDFVPWIAIVSTGAALFGIFLAATLYRVGRRVQVAVPAPLRPFYVLFSRKWFMDDIAEIGVARGLLYGGICRLAAWFDATFVDGAVNGAARLARWVSNLLRRVQSGSEQSYGLVLTGGAAVVVAVVFISALR